MNVGEFTEALMREIELVTGVPSVVSPARRSGEKTVWRVRLASYDGEWETLEVTLRHISRNMKTALERAGTVGSYLCDPGDAASAVSDNGDCVNIKRIATESSGYVSRTGHFFVISKYRIRRRCSAPSNIASVNE